MKRDMELVRKVLLMVEELEEGSNYDLRPKDGETEEERGMRHVSGLLVDAKYIAGDHVVLANGVSMVLLGQMTWDGHELLSSIRDTNTWEAVKPYANTLTLESLKTVASSITKGAIMSALGLLQ